MQTTRLLFLMCSNTIHVFFFYGLSLNLFCVSLCLIQLSLCTLGDLLIFNWGGGGPMGVHPLNLSRMVTAPLLNTMTARFLSWGKLILFRAP